MPQRDGMHTIDIYICQANKLMRDREIASYHGPQTPYPLFIVLRPSSPLAIANPENTGNDQQTSSPVMARCLKTLAASRPFH
jgi:hypothetical protein